MKLLASYALLFYILMNIEFDFICQTSKEALHIQMIVMDTSLQSLYRSVKKDPGHF